MQAFQPMSETLLSVCQAGGRDATIACPSQPRGVRTDCGAHNQEEQSA
jgi:hypothetical protein